MKAQNPKLILDTNVFIGDSKDLNELRLNYDLLITPEVIQELKYGPGKKAMMLIKTFLKKKTPSEESRKVVKRFAKKTGDNRALSTQDVGIIAAALDLIKKAGKEGLVNLKPKRMQNKFGKKNNKKKKKEGKVADLSGLGKGIGVDVNIKIDDSLDVKREDIDMGQAEGNGTESVQQIEETEGSPSKKSKEEARTEEAEVEIPEFCDGWVKNAEVTNITKNDYSGGWLGPDNISRINTKAGEESTDRLKSIGIGIVTKDFAMQNVILQMGIPLLSLDGTVIQKLKSYVLECFSCLAIEKESESKFCKKCGKDTLARVTCEYSDEGKLILFRKKNYKARQRGVRYNIPDPKGGRRINDLLISEECFKQPKVINYLRKQKGYQKKKSRQMEVDWELGWGFEDSKFKVKNFGDLDVGYGNKNPNVNSFWKNKRKRK